LTDLNWEESKDALLDPYVGDTLANPIKAVSIAFDFVQNKSTIALIGVQNDDVALAVLKAMFQTSKTPLISGSVIWEDFKSEEAFPYFVRTIPSASEIVRAIDALLDNYAVDSEVALVVNENSQSATHLAELFIQISNESMWSIGSKYTINQNQTTFESLFDDIVRSHYSIILLFVADTELVANVFASAYENNLAGKNSGYQWIVDDQAIDLNSYRVGNFCSEFFFLRFF
jgi:ABC-type branched-subunit amino acid transport system substrate-binding protein